ncbi:hypothetical protein C8J56DRAFT_1056710 [Mycena floridula]|nr:hypothetical protein C8J56DRAFT_1056710 [Mycena floridula]
MSINLNDPAALQAALLALLQSQNNTPSLPPTTSQPTPIPAPEPTLPVITQPPSNPAPPISPYQPSRVQSVGHPSISLMAAATSNQHGPTAVPAFNGMRTLGIPLPQSQGPLSTAALNVNADRLEAAARHLPHNPPLQTRQARSTANTSRPRRPRTNAIRPPQLMNLLEATPTPTLNDCLFMTEDNTLSVRLTAYVYPYLPAEIRKQGDHPWERKDEVVFHCSLFDIKDAFSEKMGLKYNVEVPVTTTVHALNCYLSGVMSSGPLEYSFMEQDGPGSSALQWTTAPDLHLEPMEFVNGAKSTGGTPIRMRSSSRFNQQSTVTDILKYNKINILPHSIYNNRFVVYFRCKFPVSAKFSLSFAGFGDESVTRRHFCINSFFYQPNQFRYDSLGNLTLRSEVEDLCHCDNDSENDTPSSPPRGPIESHASEVERVTRSNPSGRPRTIAQPGAPTVLVPSLWSRPYYEPMGRDYNIRPDTVSTDFQEAAVAGLPSSQIPELNLEAASVQELAIEFKEVIRHCCSIGDMTLALSPKQSLLVLLTNGISPGRGVADEALGFIFNSFTLPPNSNAFLKPLYDDKCSLAFSTPIQLAASTSEERLDEMTLFGAVTAMMMQSGRNPYPFSPLFLQYCSNNLDIRLLNRSIVAEYEPELYQHLCTIIDAGPTGDLSSVNCLLQSYCDRHVSSLNNRSVDAHNLLVADVLYHCVIGNQPPLHPEFQAFMKGFRLPTRSGFNFIDAIHGYPGGSQSYIALTCLSTVTGFDSLKDHLSFEINDTLLPAIQHYLPTFQPESFIREFLEGRGTPLPLLWQEVTPHFSVSLPLHRIDEPSFRSQMLVWASTGSSELRRSIVVGEENIRVVFCYPSHPQYADSRVSEPARQILAKDGFITFHTCISLLLIPAPYIPQLLERISQQHATDNLSQDQKEALFKKHLHHWMLIQILNAIGKHSIA